MNIVNVQNKSGQNFTVMYWDIDEQTYRIIVKTGKQKFKFYTTALALERMLNIIYSFLENMEEMEHENPRES